jgi:hypothetical protein
MFRARRKHKSWGLDFLTRPTLHRRYGIPRGCVSRRDQALSPTWIANEFSISIASNYPGPRIAMLSRVKFSSGFQPQLGPERPPSDAKGLGEAPSCRSRTARLKIPICQSMTAFAFISIILESATAEDIPFGCRVERFQSRCRFRMASPSGLCKRTGLLFVSEFRLRLGGS